MGTTFLVNLSFEQNTHSQNLRIYEFQPKIYHNQQPKLQRMPVVLFEDID